LKRLKHLRRPHPPHSGPTFGGPSATRNRLGQQCSPSGQQRSLRLDEAAGSRVASRARSAEHVPVAGVTRSAQSRQCLTHTGAVSRGSSPECFRNTRSPSVFTPPTEHSRYSLRTGAPHCQQQGESPVLSPQLGPSFSCRPEDTEREPAWPEASASGCSQSPTSSQHSARSSTANIWGPEASASTSSQPRSPSARHLVHAREPPQVTSSRRSEPVHASPPGQPEASEGLRLQSPLQNQGLHTRSRPSALLARAPSPDLSQRSPHKPVNHQLHKRSNSPSPRTPSHSAPHIPASISPARRAALLAEHSVSPCNPTPKRLCTPSAIQCPHSPSHKRYPESHTWDTRSREPQPEETTLTSRRSASQGRSPQHCVPLQQERSPTSPRVPDNPGVGTSP
jgi:hypothetical protein